MHTICTNEAVLHSSLFRSWLSETCINHNKQRNEYLISSSLAVSSVSVSSGERGCDVPRTRIGQSFLWDGQSLRQACLWCLVLAMTCWTGPSVSGEEAQDQTRWDGEWQIKGSSVFSVKKQDIYLGVLFHCYIVVWSHLVSRNTTTQNFAHAPTAVIISYGSCVLLYLSLDWLITEKHLTPLTECVVNSPFCLYFLKEEMYEVKWALW